MICNSLVHWVDFSTLHNSLLMKQGTVQPNWEIKSPQVAEKQYFTE